MNIINKIKSSGTARTILCALIVCTMISCVVVSSVFAVFTTKAVGIGTTSVAGFGIKVKINGNMLNEQGVVENVSLSGDDLWYWKDEVIDGTVRLPEGLTLTDNPNGIGGNVEQLLTAGNLASEEELNVYRVQPHKYNRNSSDKVEEYELAVGTSGYMPIEINTKGTDVSILVTVNAYFVNLPDGFSFTDNLGNDLVKENVTDFVRYSDTTSATENATMITYSYYLSHEEIKMYNNREYLNIGFCWKWAGEESSQSEISDFYNEIRVVGKQVVYEYEIAESTKVHFVCNKEPYDKVNNRGGIILDEAKTLNVLTNGLGDGEITLSPTNDFYLDINGKENSDTTYKIVPTKVGENLRIQKIVMGTFRREVDYCQADDRPSVIMSASDCQSVQVKISNDFNSVVTLVKSNKVYACFEDAFENMQGGDTLKLNGDCYVTKELVLGASGSGKPQGDYVIDLNGYTLTVDYSNENFSQDAGELGYDSVMDFYNVNVEIKNGTIDDSNNQVGTTISVLDNAACKLKNLTIKYDATNSPNYGCIVTDKVSEDSFTATASIIAEDCSFEIYGCGAQISAGVSKFINCTSVQTKNDMMKYSSNCIAVSSGGIAYVDGGNYTSQAYGFFVYNSGGMIVLNEVGATAPVVLKMNNNPNSVGYNGEYNYNGMSGTTVVGGNLDGDIVIAISLNEGQGALVVNGRTVSENGTYHIDSVGNCIKDQ